MLAEGQYPACRLQMKLLGTDVFAAHTLHLLYLPPKAVFAVPPHITSSHTQREGCCLEEGTESCFHIHSMWSASILSTNDKQTDTNIWYLFHLISSIPIPHITQGTNEKRVFSCNKSGKDAVGIKGNIIAWDQDIAVGRFFIATTPLANKSLCYWTPGNSAMLSTSKRDRLPQTVETYSIPEQKPLPPTGGCQNRWERGARDVFSANKTAWVLLSFGRRNVTNTRIWWRNKAQREETPGRPWAPEPLASTQYELMFVPS